MFNGCFKPRTRKDAFLQRLADDFSILEEKLLGPCATPMPLPLGFLKFITRDFSEELVLGRGGFGVVYKGILQCGKTIAVKKLHETIQLCDDQFQNEVTYLMGLKHKNVVQLLGYCRDSCSEAIEVDGKYVLADIRNLLICFEYISNKSLDEHISAESCRLEWDKRCEIIRGICYGLHYLHEECRIVHLDLKPQNILMDENMVPKIADFGISRMFGQQQSRIITKSCRGTYGYMAPEYLTNGLISTKSDMFCLGVIMIELLTGSRDYPQNSEPSSSGDFLYNVVEKWTNRLGSSPVLSDIYEISACTAIGLRCVDSDPEKRPDAWDIIEMLHEATSTGFPLSLDATSSGFLASAQSSGFPVFSDTANLGYRRFFNAMLASAVYEPVTTIPSWKDEPSLRCSMYLSNKKPAPSSSASVLPYKTANVRDHYRIGKELGQGMSGTTYRCFRKADGAEYACKSIPKHTLLGSEGYANVNREIQIMHHLSDHPDVVRIHGSYEDALFVHIVMELCAGGDLLDRIVSKQGGHSERAAAELIRKIVGVVDGCHSLGVVHGDLKPENILFAGNAAEDATLKLTGFDRSVFYMPADKFSGITGSTYYAAPEVLQKCYGPEADIWSVGVILYILLSGIPPFWAETEEGIASEIVQGKLDFESDPWPSISDSAKDVVRCMLTRDPKKRLRVHEVLCHPWISDDSTAPNKPTDSAVLSRLKHFSAMNLLSKMALKVIAESMSEEEIGGLKLMFKKFDTDNSGNITFDELKDGLKRLGSALSDTEIQTLMDAADIDSSGAVDCAEFVAATLHMNKLEKEENLLRAFSFFDKDGNGYITTDELSEACRQFGVDVVHLEDLMKDIDQNNDGQIDYSEFVAMVRKGNAAEPRGTPTCTKNLGTHWWPGKDKI